MATCKHIHIVHAINVIYDVAQLNDYIFAWLTYTHTHTRTFMKAMCEHMCTCRGLIIFVNSFMRPYCDRMHPQLGVYKVPATIRMENALISKGCSDQTTKLLWRTSTAAIPMMRARSSKSRGRDGGSLDRRHGRATLQTMNHCLNYLQNLHSHAFDMHWKQ